MNEYLGQHSNHEEHKFQLMDDSPIPMKEKHVTAMIILQSDSCITLK